MTLSSGFASTTFTKSTTMRRFLLYIFLLLRVAVFSHADVPDNQQHVLSGDKSNGATGNTLPPEPPAAQHVQPGAGLVDAALVELRKLHQPLHYKIRKNPGILRTVLHLASKALPAIRLTAPSPASSHDAVSGPLLHATRLLEESAQKNNSDALYILGDMNFYGNFSHPRNLKTAFSYYQKLALLNGNSSAMYMMGVMYSTGVGGAVEPDQARALLYYTFAANQGHTRAEMAVAHRHYAGIGTTKNCETAVKYYKRVADKAIAWYRSGPPGGMSWISESHRIADELGGIYGVGASVSSSGQNAPHKNPTSDAQASIEDILEYLDLMSQKGDVKATFNLGRIFYDGQRNLPRDYAKAREYFLKVASKTWNKKGQVFENKTPSFHTISCRAAGYIGRMYLRGEGVEQNFRLAEFWFRRGNEQADQQSRHGLGLMYLNGYGVEQNLDLALKFFNAAAETVYPPSHVQLAALYLDQGQSDEDIYAANHHLDLAAKYYNMEAYYYIGEMTYFGLGRERQCEVALNYYKAVAEKVEPFVSSWAEANLAYEAGEIELAFLEYLHAAEQGYETAQNNVAYILDPQKSYLTIPQWLFPKAQKLTLLQNPTLALIYWTRSSRQGNIDATVKMGDYYLFGIGTDADVDKAVQCYTAASEHYQSAQALWNLGWMHENGIGLTQDYHLAKRYYDTALETNDEAYLPVSLSLLKLRARSAWNTFTNGRINSIQDEPTEKKEWSLSEWINNFLQDEMGYYGDDMYDGYEDAMPGADSDLGAFEEGDILETLVIMGLAAALVFLVLYRQQRQQAARRQQEDEARRQPQEQQGQGVGRAAGGAFANGQQQQRAGNGGFFPQPGAPGFGQWAVGGVGH
ncbi:ubiquitin-protein ligase [Neurospora intermedia]|uniref:Ubiquitin-protein ligase n=1 Tax=Neurospora intermedia TaxID=5142 RepID=A0ABR3D8H0_NEUIN